MKNFFFGFIAALLVVVAFQCDFSRPVTEEKVSYLVSYKAVVNDTFHGGIRETVATNEYVLPARQPVNEEYFRRLITTDLSNYLEGELSPLQIHVKILSVESTPCTTPA